MSRNIALFVAVLALFAPRLAGATEGWERLRSGMSRVETAAALGEPLMRTANKGFEIWFYDHRAEVVFFSGPVVAWTAPTSTSSARVRPSGADVILVPGLRLTPRRSLTPRRGVSTDGYAPAVIQRFKSRY